MKAGSAIALLLIISWVGSPAELPSIKTIKLPADNPMASLKPGPGLKTVQAYCGMCHSTDYIVIQPHQSADAWRAEVTRMETAFGAPIPKADAQVIAQYLAARYSTKASKKGSSRKAQ
jgi:sulfite dehydrogenase (cytochrome) subunit B